MGLPARNIRKGTSLRHIVHGEGTIVELFTKTVNDADTRYVTVQFNHGGITWRQLIDGFSPDQSFIRSRTSQLSLSIPRDQLIADDAWRLSGTESISARQIVTRIASESNVPIKTMLYAEEGQTLPQLHYHINKHMENLDYSDSSQVIEMVQLLVDWTVDVQLVKVERVKDSVRGKHLAKWAGKLQRNTLWGTEILPKMPLVLKGKLESLLVTLAFTMASGKDFEYVYKSAKQLDKAINDRVRGLHSDAINRMMAEIDMVDILPTGMDDIDVTDEEDAEVDISSDTLISVV